MQNQSRTPQHLPPSAHQISLSAVSKPALEVIAHLTRAGHEAYLVGGCVRDLLLHYQPKDFDVATSAYPEEVRGLFRNCRLIGRRFRLAHVRIDREIVEVATFRTSVNNIDDFEQHHVSAEGQIMRDNVYGRIEDDAFRRDFTVNALYYDPNSQQVIDYVDGVAHLNKGQLLTIGDADERFREDPVRMLRAVRFSVKLGFTLNEFTKNAITECAPLLHHVSPSRMLDEVLKLFHNGYAVDNFRALRELGLLGYLFPFTEQCIEEAENNMAFLALANTDQRVNENKPVIPAFLFASFLWEPLSADANKLMDNGMRARAAYSTATYDLLRDQATHVAIPKRIGMVVREIWNLQYRLEQRPPKSIATLLRHPRFRAAYDFLLLRQSLGEVSQDLTDWWTHIQEVDLKAQQEMISALKSPPKRRRRRRRRVA